MPRFGTGRTPWALALSAFLGPPSPVLLVRACFACVCPWAKVECCVSLWQSNTRVTGPQFWTLSSQLPGAVLGDVRACCAGQPVVMSGDLNPRPTNSPCLSKSISQAMCVGLLITFACWKDGKNQHAPASFICTTSKGSRLLLPDPVPLQLP